MLNKLKSFFLRLVPSKRRIIQLYAALLYNANIKGFITGEIFKGVSKSACLPGLNCYSCPGAIGACPLGSLQNALSESKTKFPTYILGIILLYCIILGRTICGFLCPFGLIQELLYKIKSPKLKKNKITRALSYFKYVLLVVLVIIIPLMYALQVKNIPLPAFCKYICPAGTLEGAVFLLANPNNSNFFGMLGSLFTWKFILLIIFLVSSVFIFRFFCRFFCPLGAIYGLFNKLSIFGVKVDKSNCTHCQSCITHCKMDVKEVGDHECIQCGECRNVCHVNAISWKVIHNVVKEELKEEENNDKLISSSVKDEDLEKELTTESEHNIVDFSAKKSEFKKIPQRKFNVIVSSLAVIVLVIILISVNFKKEVLQLNDVCTELNVTMFDSTSFDIKFDDKSTILYFYETLSNQELETLKRYSDEKMNILLISSFDNKINEQIKQNIKLTSTINDNVNITESLIKELAEFNIRFAYDDKSNKTLLTFIDKEQYPYCVFLDFTDKILIKDNKLISADDYISVISQVNSGKTIGNEIGNICYNKEINLIDSNDVFSVLNNRGKITVINFWYTGCTPCVKELPFFNKLQEEYIDDVTVIAIHAAGEYNRNPDAVVKFIENHFSEYSILFGYDDSDSEYYATLGGVGEFPTTMIVDQEGIVSFVRSGSLTEEELRSEIEKLLN